MSDYVNVAVLSEARDVDPRWQEKYVFMWRKYLIAAIKHFVCSMLPFAMVAMIATPVCAQSAKDGYTHRIRNARSIKPLGPSLMGDSTNMQDGSTTFTVTDVSIPTNSGLPLSIGRTFRVDSTFQDQMGGVTSYSNSIFPGPWDADIPYMVGTFDAQRGWIGPASDGAYAGTQARCTEGGAGPPAAVGVGDFYRVYYQPESYFSGIYINIPGSGMQEMLRLVAGTPQTIGGHTYYYKTKNNWMVGCVATLKKGAGEGFTVTLPNGTVYTFDWMATRPTTSIVDDSCGQAADVLPTLDALNDGQQQQYCHTNYAVPRVQVFIFATKVTDRFGNTLTYTFDPNIAEHLQKIQSSDGGEIDLTYGANNVSKITAGSRQWQYVSDTGTYQWDVILPDGSRWSYSYGSNLYQVTKYNSHDVWAGCHINIGTLTTDVSPGAYDTNIVTIKHPSGTIGTFKFRRILHGTRQAEAGCYMWVAGGGWPATSTPIITDPSDYQTASLVEKTLSIPGAASLDWTFKYYPGWTAPYQSKTVEIGPSGIETDYVYGSDHASNFGQLLSESIIDGSNIVRATTYQYLESASGQNFNQWGGGGMSRNYGWGGGFVLKNTPLIQKIITQQSRSFEVDVDTGCPTAEVYCFDSFVRPTKVTESSQ
ncbi:hypothetical protein [Oleiagrimonas soli]|uniref:Uncharacterized protein n=1 Tax=Oleiagrimonas soli TaxID=1543381 RepID=A0A841KPR7_9GAMM|nr:hypothetical protein [Oleiagrimonas soli]MBB6184651.1 hypothetical protein [Oleiagrimonas soli]